MLPVRLLSPVLLLLSVGGDTATVAAKYKDEETS